MNRQYIYILIAALALSACSITKHLPDGEQLYTGIKDIVPLIFRAAVKPTPSISREQDSVSLARKEDTKLVIQGRHDPCIVPRAVPVVEAVVACAVLDLMNDKP